MRFWNFLRDQIMRFWDLMTRKEERARLNAAYHHARESVKCAATNPEAERAHPAPELFDMLKDAREAVDALAPIDWSARQHVEQASGIMPLIIEAAHNGRPTPSIIDHLRSVYDLLEEAQTEDNRRPSVREMLRPRHLAATVAQWGRGGQIVKR